MTAKLSQDILDALQAANGGEVEALDPVTGRIYFVVDDQTHRRAMQALKQQEDLAAIQQGIADMEAGRTQPAAEAHRHGREQLIAKYQQ